MLIYDGVLFDLIIDYLMYVFVFVIVLFKYLELLLGWMGWFVIMVIVFILVLYFVDICMKIKDNFFVGFLGCWNMFVLVMFVIKLDYYVILVLVVLLVIVMFLLIKFIYFICIKWWWNVSLFIVMVWIGFVVWVVWVDFYL